MPWLTIQFIDSPTYVTNVPWDTWRSYHRFRYRARRANTNASRGTQQLGPRVWADFVLDTTACI